MMVFLNGVLQLEGEDQDYIIDPVFGIKFMFRVREVDVLFIITQEHKMTSYHHYGDSYDGVWLPDEDTLASLVEMIAPDSTLEIEEKNWSQDVIVTVPSDTDISELYKQVVKMFGCHTIDNINLVFRRPGKEGDVDEAMWRLGKWGG